MGTTYFLYWRYQRDKKCQASILIFSNFDGPIQLFSSKIEKLKLILKKLYDNFVVLSLKKLLFCNNFVVFSPKILKIKKMYLKFV